MRRIHGRDIQALCLLSILVSGCATRSGRPSGPLSDPPSGPPAVTDASPGVTAGDAVLRTALDLRGIPYREGGQTPDGFDCSGFVRYVFALHGVELPRMVSDQFGAGTPIAQDALAAGDLVFFTTVATGASHVGMSTGDGRFVHAPSSRGKVRVEDLGSPYWTQRYLGARRVLRD